MRWVLGRAMAYRRFRGNGDRRLHALGYPQRRHEADGLVRNNDGVAPIQPDRPVSWRRAEFWGLGFLPCWVLAKILDSVGWLRVPREVELAGLDTHDYGDAFPYHAYRDTAMEDIDRDLAKS